MATYNYIDKYTTYKDGSITFFIDSVKQNFTDLHRIWIEDEHGVNLLEYVHSVSHISCDLIVETLSSMAIEVSETEWLPFAYSNSTSDGFPLSDCKYHTQGISFRFKSTLPVDTKFRLRLYGTIRSPNALIEPLRLMFDRVFNIRDTQIVDVVNQIATPVLYGPPITDIHIRVSDKLGQILPHNDVIVRINDKEFFMNKTNKLIFQCPIYINTATTLEFENKDAHSVEVLCTRLQTIRFSGGVIGFPYL